MGLTRRSKRGKAKGAVRTSVAVIVVAVLMGTAVVPFWTDGAPQHCPIAF